MRPVIIFFCHVILTALTHFSTSGFTAPTARYPITNQSPLYIDSMSQPSINLPEKLIVGYANWNQCDDGIIEAVQRGVNVVIWFSINLSIDKGGRPVVTNGPDWDCVAEKVSRIRSLGLETVHLISIGGWNAPHPDVSIPVELAFSNWNKWNREIISRPSIGYYGFDGFDWDIEGNDDVSSEYNEFSPSVLDFIGQFSQLAKREGYVVSMAPAESYFDPLSAPTFDRSLRHEYDEWKPLLSCAFPYHGRNCYAYLLARYGQTLIGEETMETFDFVTIQLYEGYSHVQYDVTQKGVPPSEALFKFCRRVTNDWFIDFSTDSELTFDKKCNMKLLPSRLVVGLANGWAGDGKFLLIFPEDIQVAYETLVSESIAPRGFAFWNILDEGRSSPMNPDKPIFLASSLNSFLQIRR